MLIPTLFFVLGNVAAVLVRNVAERLSKRWMGRILFWRAARPAAGASSRAPCSPRETLARIVPGVTTYDEVLGLCGPDVEEQSSD